MESKKERNILQQRPTLEKGFIKSSTVLPSSLFPNENKQNNDALFIEMSYLHNTDDENDVNSSSEEDSETSSQQQQQQEHFV